MSRFSPFASVRGRLALWYGLAVGTALVLYAGIVYATLRTSLMASLDRQLRDDYEVAEQMLERRADGTIAWRESHPGDPEETYADADTWVEVRDAAGSLKFRRPAQSPADVSYRTFEKPHAMDGVPFVLRVGRSEDALRGELDRLVAVFGLGLAPMVAVACLVGWLLARRALAPVAAMSERAESITAERLSDRLPVGNPRDELGRLASVINGMVARLERSFEQLRRFTADASHELRTPLTAIRSVGEVGLRERRDDRGYREVIGSMLEEVDRLTQLVDSLLVLTRGDTGHVRIAPRPTDLVGFARDVAGHLGVLAEEKRQTLTVSSAGPVTAEVDPLVLRQAITNLVDNAIKYGPESSPISVTVAEQDGAATISVHDVGPGIPEDHRDRVFERFYRVDPARPRGGAGLGLAIAKWAVEAHGGRIEVESEEGRGSTFRIVLPRARPSPSSAEGSPSVRR